MYVYRLFADDLCLELMHAVEYSDDEFQALIVTHAPAMADLFFVEHEFHYLNIHDYYTARPGLYSVDILEHIYKYLIKHLGFVKYEQPQATAALQLCDGVFGGMLIKYNRRNFDAGDANAAPLIRQSDATARAIYNEFRKHLEQIPVKSYCETDL